MIFEVEGQYRATSSGDLCLIELQPGCDVNAMVADLGCVNPFKCVLSDDNTRLCYDIRTQGIHTLWLKGDTVEEFRDFYSKHMPTVDNFLASGCGGSQLYYLGADYLVLYHPEQLRVAIIKAL